MSTRMTIQEAFDAFNGVRIDDLNGFPPEIQERIPQSRVTAEANAVKVDHTRLNSAHQLMLTALNAPTARQRIMWLQSASQAFNDAHSANAACKKGCSHCCHIPLKLTHAEAHYIGRKIGRKPNPVSPSSPEPDIQGYASPCPFLKDNACSIHSARPSICRTHLNMDQDDLLCRLTPGQAVPVPYADPRDLLMALVAISGNNAQIADIRQWFGPSN